MTPWIPVWVLIIIVQGWGAGVGSTGNSVASVQFSTKETCEAAAAAIRSARTSTGGWDKPRADSVVTVCVRQ